MKALLDRIIESRYKANTFFYENPVKPKPNEPASATELQQLDRFLASKGAEAPASYRSFLSIYNGIENVLGRGYSLLSIDQVVNRKDDVMEEVVDEFPTLCVFVIGSGNTPNFMGFDIGTPAVADGYELAEITGTGDQWRYRSFEDFLNRLLMNLEENIRTQEKDRNNLPP